VSGSPIAAAAALAFRLGPTGAGARRAAMELADTAPALRPNNTARTLPARTDRHRFTWASCGA
jgi:hypothetical protein